MTELGESRRWPSVFLGGTAESNTRRPKGRGQHAAPGARRATTNGVDNVPSCGAHLQLDRPSVLPLRANEGTPEPVSEVREAWLAHPGGVVVGGDVPSRVVHMVSLGGGELRAAERAVVMVPAGSVGKPLSPS